MTKEISLKKKSRAGFRQRAMTVKEGVKSEVTTSSRDVRPLMSNFYLGQKTLVYDD
jgi:hypothetical protein